MDYSEQKKKIEDETYNLEQYWNVRNQRMREDRDIINLVKPPKKTDQSNWITNEPKVFFDTSRSLVSLNDPTFRLPLTMNYTSEQKNKMNKAERLCIGVYRALNQREVDKGGVSWLWDLAYYVLLGWYAVFNVVQKDPQTGEIKFIADVYDPMTVYPLWDANDLTRCVRSYYIDKITALSMAESLINQLGEGEFIEPTQSEHIKVINFWEKTYIKNKPVIKNGIMIDGQVIKPLTVQKKLDHIPIHIGAIGYPDKMMDNWMERMGEAIISSNRDMYDYINVIMRLNAEILAETAYHNIITKSRTGQPLVKEVKGHGQIIPIRLEDQIEVLKHASTPQEANVLLQYLLGQAKKASASDMVYGSTPFESSGFAISQLLASIKYKLGMYINSIQSITGRVMTDFLYQYKKGKYEPITLTTTNPYDLKRGLTYLEEFSPDDVPERIYVDAKIDISSVTDKTQTILNSVQALQAGLLSRETLWETELNIQDSEQEKERIREDQLMTDPFIKDIEIIETMWERVEMYQTMGKQPQAEALKRYIMQKEMSLGMRKGIPETGGQQGVSPNQLPPEMSQSPNPDQKRAMLGMSPPGLNRRPQTPEERQASKQGTLVSPTGEVLI